MTWKGLAWPRVRAAIYSLDRHALFASVRDRNGFFILLSVASKLLLNEDSACGYRDNNGCKQQVPVPILRRMPQDANDVPSVHMGNKGKRGVTDDPRHTDN